MGAVWSGVALMDHSVVGRRRSALLPGPALLCAVLVRAWISRGACLAQLELSHNQSRVCYRNMDELNSSPTVPCRDIM